MKPLTRAAALLLLPLVLAACNLPDFGSALQPPTPIPVPSPTPLPAAEVLLTLLPPEGTPANGDLAVMLLDEVTGLPYGAQEVPMTRLEDGRWQVRLTPAVGSLLKYRYVRRVPGRAEEVTALGTPVRYRVLHVPGPLQVEDIAAGWSDTPYQGPTGRVLGRVLDAATGQPLPEILVSGGGLLTLTDGEGEFRLEGLPPGLHRLTFFHPDGAYRPAQQGALVAADSTTPAELSLQPATPVNVTFEVTVPSDTIPGTPVRIAGNLRALGNTFAELPGGVSLSGARLPTLTYVDATHYLFLTQLYAGTDLRYKYTLGDGLWNAERDRNGALLTRQVIIPEQELILQDVVASWHGGSRGSIMFHVTVPETTPPTDTVAIQFNPFTWFEPLPMWRLGEREWFFALHGPLDFSTSLNYRYCRNLQCGAADDMDTAGPQSAGRRVTATVVGQDLRDQVRGWQWWDGAGPAAEVVAPDPLNPRPAFEAGVELLPAYRPSWLADPARWTSEAAAMGASHLTLTPTWTLTRAAPVPLMELDPARGPFRPDLEAMVATARAQGLEPVLRPTLRPPDRSLETWWLEAPRDDAWWTVWFEEYRSFALTFARLAQDLGVAKLVLGGPEVAPALPGGSLPDGTPSDPPPVAEARWRELLEEVRARYSGRLAFELDLGAGLQPPPPVLDQVDEVHLYWHAPLGEGKDLSVAEMQQGAAVWLDQVVLAEAALQGKPLVLSVEYLSVDGAATACVPRPDGSCRPPEDFDLGAVVDVDLPVDLEEQARAVNAVLLEAYARPEITGFYTRRYNPLAALKDKSASVNGKPARDVLWYWYTRIRGQTSP